ncbi:MAG: helix-turn-helix transcriptional regulator [Spirochaetia bacterium]
MAIKNAPSRTATSRSDAGASSLPVFRKFSFGGNEIIVVSAPAGGLDAGSRCAGGPDGGGRDGADLSAAERAIFELIREGHSDAGIAKLRGTAPRTVHKQVHSIYRKLGVSCRNELLARY